MNRIAKASVCTILSLALILAGCSVSWINTALADLPVITQVALNIASIVSAADGSQVSPAVATQVQAIANQVKSDLTLVQSLITSYQSATAAEQPGIVQKISAVLSDVQSNLNAILTAVHVNDAALQATIVAAVGVAVTTVASIASLLPASPAPAPASSSASAKSTHVAKTRPAIKPPSASQLKKQFNAIFAANGFPQAELK
ncbi:MAG: hypothetical protein WBD87_14920 [Candidatus Acidiferrales bacterium]